MKKTLALYAVQDVNDNFPEFIHDHNFTLFEQGRIATYFHQERITGRKYDNTLHKGLYSYLKQGKIIQKDYDVAFVDSVVGKSFISAEGNIRFEANPFVSPQPHPVKGKLYWLDSVTDGWLVSHELAHIFSSVPFYGMFKDNSLLIHFDGGASESNFSVWTWKDAQLKLISYDWKAKYLSSLFNANALNFFILGVKRKEHNSLAGKYMGYAGHGNYSKEIEHWLRENNFFEQIWHDKQFFFKKAKEKFGWNKTYFDTHDQFLMNIAATVQTFFTREMISILRYYQEKTQTEYLYYTGGSALNLQTNNAIIQENIFKKIFIPPATNDSGLSIGAGAFLQWYKGYEIQKHKPYLGNWLLNSPQTIEATKSTIKFLAKQIAEGKTVALYNGWSEAGPRALGNRSIIARADNINLARKISTQMKGREWYRPIAPVMLEETAKTITKIKAIPEIARYMLINFRIKPEYRNFLKGVLHKDNTSRIQTIPSRDFNPFLHDLLLELIKQYDIPALINTSFNSKGKPIVHFEYQAKEQAKEMRVDYLVINGEIV